MKAYVEMKVQIHVFLTSAVVEGEWSLLVKLIFWSIAGENLCL
jgi:hypothetical protein